MFLHTEQLLHRMQTLLEDEQANLDGERLAHEFARRWNGACQRLEECDKLLDYGDAYTALQIAETPPLLLNVLDQLSFAQLDAWKKLCQRKKWSLPAHALNQGAIRRLEALYEKPVRGNHPRYRQLQGAMLRKDFAAAVHHLRILAAENPSDPEIRSQRILFEKKVLAEEVASLENHLRQNQPGEAIQRWQKLTQQSWAIPLESPVFEQLQALANQNAEEQQRQTQETLWQKVRTAALGGNPDATRAAVDQLAEWQARHNLALSPEDEEELQQYRDRITAWDEAESFQEEGQAKLENWEKAIQGSSLFSLSQLLRAEQDVLAWQEEKEARDHLPEPLPATTSREEWERRFEQARERSGEVKTRLKQRRRQLIGLTAAVFLLLFLTVASIFGLRWRSNQYLRDLDLALRTADAPTLITFHEDRPAPRGLRNEEIWRERMSRSSAIIDQQTEALSTWEEKEGRLRGLLQSREIVEQSAQIDRLLSDLAAGLEHLPPSRQASREATLTDLQDQFEERTAAQREAFFDRVRQVLNRLDDPEFDLQQEPDPTVVQTAMNRMTEILRQLDDLLDPEHIPFPLPDDLQSRTREVQNKRLTQLTAWQNYRRSTAALRRMTNLTEYQQTIEALQDLPFSFPDLEAMRRWQERSDTIEEPLTSLFAPFLNRPVADLPEPANWLLPTPTTPEEETVLRRLQSTLSEANLEGIFRYDALETMPGGQIRRFPVHVRGDIRTESFTVGREFETSHLTLLTIRGEEAATWQRERLIGTDGRPGPWEGRWLTNPRRVSEPALARQLIELLDRRTGSITRPLLPLLDQMHRDEEISPLFKLFVDTQLDEVFQTRPPAWGIDFSPEYQAHRRQLRDLLGSHRPTSRDWLFPQQFETLFAEAKAYYASLPGNFSERATIRYHLNRLLPQESVELIGYFEENGRFQQIRNPRHDSLLALPGHESTYRLITRGDLAERQTPGYWLPYAPVLALENPLDSILNSIARQSEVPLSEVQSLWQTYFPTP